MVDLIASLDGIDDYGIPPLTVYHRFNTAGGDVHGSSAFAQGARGWSLGVDGSFNFANLVAPGSPVVLAAGAGVDGARTASTAVLLYRMPEHLSKQNHVSHPLALASLNGVTWSGTGKLNAKAGVSADLLKVIAGGKLILGAGLQGAMHTTRLRSDETDYFLNSARTELADAVDRLLVMELRKACANILVANAGWMRKHLIDVVGGAASTAKDFGSAANKAVKPNDQGKPSGSGLALQIAEAVHADDVRRAAVAAADKAAAVATPVKDRVLSEFEKEDGWKLALAAEYGAAATVALTGVAAYAAGKAALEKLETTDEELSKGLEALQRTYEGQIAALEANSPLTRAQAEEVATLTEASYRLIGYRDALIRKQHGVDRAFRRGSPINPGASPKVDAASLYRTEGTILTVTSKDWEVRGDLNASAKAIVVGNAEFHLGTSVSGRHTTSMFRMRAANDLVLFQHVHSVFIHSTATAAHKMQLLHTGSDAIDKAVFDKFRQEDSTTQSKPGAPFAKRFGALSYRAANAYCYVDTSPYLVAPGVSGVTLGVSVRVRPLCNYTEAIRKGGPDTVLAGDYVTFEKWLTGQLGCTAADLRQFVKDAPLGAGYAPLPDVAEKASAEHGHAIGYPDALLIEVAYVDTARSLPKIPAPVDRRDLFGYHGFKDLKQFQGEVVSGKRRAAAMRLRYRVQSPLSRTSKKSPRLGFSFGDHASFGLQAGRVSEVGQESIADLYTLFKDDNDDLDQALRYELVPPPVVLFNRG